jgi:hypothetical protein
MTFRVVSWNMRFAGPSSKTWEYVLGLKPDVALLQEVTGIPNVITDRYSAVILPTSGPAGEQQGFSTVVLAGACHSERPTRQSRMARPDDKVRLHRMPAHGAGPTHAHIQEQGGR